MHDKQQHFVAPADEVEVLATDRVLDKGTPTSIWGDAWRRLRRNPVFLVSVVMIVFVMLVVIWPALFTSQDPRLCLGEFGMDGPREGHPFGFDKQGCDVYARTIYGARASVSVGMASAMMFLLVGGILGAISGFYGGLLDTIVSRIAEIFYAIPMVLAAIVLLQLLRPAGIMTVVAILVAFTWPQAARITRGAVIEAKNSEYVTAAKALGVSRLGTLMKHVLPNSASPLIVVATIWLGVFIVTEATLSYLGVGLPPSIVSWGADIDRAKTEIRTSPILFYPATALAITVLSFIMLGDAVRDALDPKERTR
ncbi:ABC transporter permease [Nocardia fluminea]|jgi:oligopeptide transport system permease protein|uniref:Oligopeptide transport system permease protein n=1 Tax=Nocardia fluminea TaxID=134984 RepID=A0A2N3V9L2_9NOCA|nr:ABC transporter permease [Nocardia fluminea]PKV78332.1 oligopeptide transport system permease protein [Nocardia fluminea]